MISPRQAQGGARQHRRRRTRTRRWRRPWARARGDEANANFAAGVLELRPFPRASYRAENAGPRYHRDRHSRFGSVGRPFPAAAPGPFEDGAEVAVQRGVHLAALRAGGASHAVMNGVPVPVVSRLLGHSNTRMTLRYAHLGDRDIEAAAERVGLAVDAIMNGRSRS